MAILPYLVTLVLAVGSLAILYGIWSVFYNTRLHRLRDFPGPLLGGASIAYSSYYRLTGRYSSHMNYLHAKYGTVVRIAPNELSYISAQAWQDIYASRTGDDQRPNFEKDGSAFAGRRKIYTMMSAPEKAHQRMRQVLSHAFSDKALASQEGIVQSYVKMFINKLRVKSQDPTKSTVDIVSWLNFVCFDTTSDLMFGQPLQCLEFEAFDTWASFLLASMKIAEFLRVARRVPSIVGTFMMMGIFVMAPKNGAQNLAIAHKSTEDRLAKGITTRGDFVDEILTHNEEKGITDEELKASSTQLILAGSETTATLLSGALFYLLRNEIAMQTLTKEIRQSFKSGEEITFKASADLENLNAALQETLRIYPPVTETIARVVPKPGFVIDGRFVPGGALVGIQQYAAYHSSRNFKQPDSFVPERWLGDAQFHDDNRDVVKPFGAGPRDCLGQQLAWAETRVILARLIWEFDMELVSQSHTWPNQKNRMLWEKPALQVSLRPRK